MENLKNRPFKLVMDYNNYDSNYCMIAKKNIKPINM